MAYLIPFSQALCNEFLGEFSTSDYTAVLEMLERRIPGEKWDARMRELIQNRDEIGLHKMAFASACVDQRTFNQGTIDHTKDEENEVELQSSDILVASRKLLPADAHQFILNWLAKPTIGKKGQGLYLLSAEEATALMALIAQNQDLQSKVEPLDSTAFDKYQGFDLVEWEEIIFSILGFIVHYCKTGTQGIAFSHQPFFLPERENLGEISVLDRAIEAFGNVQGLTWHRGWLYKIRNRDNLFTVHFQRDMDVEPEDAIIFVTQNRRGTMQHIAFLNTKGEQFHQEPPKPTLKEWILDQSYRWDEVQTNYGPCKRANCPTCMAATKMRAIMLSHLGKR